MRALILALLLSLPGAALAAPIWGHRFEGSVPPGKQPTLTLRPENTVHEVTLVLRSEAGVTHRFTAKVIKAGATKAFSWPVPPGVSTWKGELTGSADGETTVSNIDLKVISLGPLSVEARKEDVDLVAGRIVVKPNRPLDKVEVLALDENSQVAIDGPGLVSNEGDTSVITFNVPDGASLRVVKLKLFDEYGFWFIESIASWHVEIEHEEVVFETGKWDIRPSEEPKLERAIAKAKEKLAALDQELARYREALGETAKVQWRLYVAGYTDTVGGPAENRELSLKRARSIATFFKQRGVGVPIHYQGYGEGALKVSTGDNVDEVQNRRAAYTLGANPPSGKDYPSAGWLSL